MASKVSKFLRSSVNQIQEVENAASRFFTAFNLDTASAAQLDLIGEWLNEPRMGQTDVEYRDSLYFKIATDTATGAAELIIETINRITSSTYTRLEEVFPAKIAIFMQATHIPAEFETRTKRIVAGGVDIKIHNSYGTPFVFDNDDDSFPATPAPDYGLGFDELNWLPHVGGQITEFLF